MKRYVFFISPMLIFFLVSILPAQSPLNPGDLDPTFGTDGLVFTDFGGASDNAQGVVVQPDGKIVVAGTGVVNKARIFAVARYEVDGELDSSFGSGGKVTTAIGESPYANAVALQPDGKIVVAGVAIVTRDGGSFHDFALVRYKTNGALDSTFDGDGKVTTAVASGLSTAYAVVVQPDGKIVVAGDGYVTEDGSSDFRMVLVRYKTNGQLDSTFGGDGRVTTTIGDKASARAVALQPDGKIVAAGIAETRSPSKRSFALVRYMPDGELDPSFGDDGVAYASFSSSEAHAVALQSDGKIVAAGYGCESYTCGFGVVRHNADGQPDPTFSKDGRVVSVIRTRKDRANAIALQPDGKIIVGGFSNLGLGDDSTLNDLALARYDSHGNLDSTFGVDGTVVTIVIVGNDDRVTALTLQQNGKIVVAGYRTLALHSVDFVVGRYIGYFPADLRLSTDVTEMQAQVREDLASSITITNSGPETATDVVVKNVPAMGLAIILTTPSQGTCSSEGGLTSCRLGSLANGESATIQVQLRPWQDGNLAYSATVEAGTVDQNLSDNKLTVSIQAASPPPTSTSASASAPVCGDGVVDTGEQCDDGNRVDGDGCSSGCISETSESETETESQSQSSTGGGGCSCNLCRQ